jgi:hypothetical protein
MVSSEILTSNHRAKVEMPRNIVIDIAPMIPRVVAALCALGSRNACTPLAIASTPVRAVDPEANARRTRNSPTTPTSASRSTPEEMAVGHSPSRHWMNPVTSIVPTVATNR